MKKKLVHFLSALVVLSQLAGCGAAAVTSPPDQTIVKAPEEISWGNVYGVFIGVLKWEDSTIPTFPEPARKDRVLVETLLQRGVPKEQIIFLEDEKATGAEILSKLGSVLSNTKANSTFIFYYDGHGDNDPVPYVYNYDIKYNHETKSYSNYTRLAQVGDLIKERFQGNLLIFLGDFCYSGALMQEAKKQTRPAVALTSINDGISTPRWTYTETLIDLFSGKASSDLNQDGKITFSEAHETLKKKMLDMEEQTPGFSYNTGFKLDMTLSIVLK